MKGGRRKKNNRTTEYEEKEKQKKKKTHTKCSETGRVCEQTPIVKTPRQRGKGARRELKREKKFNEEYTAIN